LGDQIRNCGVQYRATRRRLASEYDNLKLRGSMIRQIAPQFFTTDLTATLAYHRDMPWRSREFVVKDCDGRLLAFGANSE
jgi:hypothetical protein